MKIIYPLLTLLIFNVFTASSQTANFTYSTPDNLFCTPETVTFTASSTGNPTGYIWNFGDGTSGGSPVENHLYDYPGTYSVTLTAVYANSAVSVTKTVVINETPSVTISADRSVICQPGQILLTATVTGAVTAYTYVWDYGDNSPLQTTTNNSITHSFNNYGSYTVNVKATNPAGCSATGTIQVSVAKFPIAVSVSPTSGCLPANSTMTATTTFPAGDGLQNIIWNFGDGTPNVTTTSASVSHQYNTTNPITTANVNITSNQGCTNQFTIPSFAFGIPPTNTNAYTIALRDTFCGSETIQFYGFADSANSYTWDFGDGTNQTTSAVTVNHKYSTLGNMQVSLTPFYNGCPGPVRVLNIHITGVIAAYTYSNTCSDKKTFSFANNSLGNVSSYEWSYSDQPGFYETTNYSPTHTFPASATSLVMLKVIDDITGCRDSLASTIYTANPVLVVDKFDVCKDSAITYTVQNTYPAGSPYNYEMHLNGNIVPIGPNTSYTAHPRNFGTYSDYFVISDNLSGTCNDTIIVSPIKVQGPYVNFTLPARICIDSLVTFTNNSYPFFPNDSIVKWRWDFADGQKDSVRNPVPHKYNSPGQHVITLEATDNNGCKQKFEGTIGIARLPNFLVVFPKIDTLCLGQNSTLSGYTSDSLIWLTTTNLTCASPSCDTVTVNPATTTQYVAMAITQFGCKSYDTSLIKVYNPINLSVTPSASTVCAGVPVQLMTNAQGITTWSPGTYLNNSTISNPIATPDANTIYTIRVRDSVGCFSDSAIVTLNIYPKPQVNAGPDQLLNYNQAFTLSPTYSAGVQSYSWTPAGNLSCTNCPTPSGFALGRQQYTIEITDANSCKAKDSVIVYISCEKSNLLLPTAFTPNGDGLNDRFFPIARGYQSIKSFSIYNRNGQKIFERQNFQPNNSSDGWDGRIRNGLTDNTQSYVWVVEGICDTGMSVVTKGSVTLIK